MGNLASKSDLTSYQQKGDYATKTELGNYTLKSVLPSYATKTELVNYQSKGDYATKTELGTYQPKGDYAPNYVNQVDFILGASNTERGNTGSSRALVKDVGGKLVINYGNDFVGGVDIGASGGMRVYGTIDAKGYTINGTPVGQKGDKGDVGNLSDPVSVKNTLSPNTLWCVDGELCKIPGQVNKRGIDWGYGASKILDDGHLRIQSDDNIILQTTNKSISMDSAGDLVLGAGQKICNSDKSVCLDVAEIVNTRDKFGIISSAKYGTEASRLSTYGPGVGWKNDWDTGFDKQWSQLEFKKF